MLACIMFVDEGVVDVERLVLAWTRRGTRFSDGVVVEKAWYVAWVVSERVNIGVGKAWNLLLSWRVKTEAQEQHLKGDSNKKT